MEGLILENKNKKEILFHAECLYGGTEGEDEDKFYLVGFADDEYDTINYLMLQKALTFDEQDKEQGMDQVYIEFKDQSHSYYGGITRLEITDDSFIFGLEANTAKALDLPQSFTITISRKHKKLKSVLSYLDKIFKENKGVLVKS